MVVLDSNGAISRVCLVVKGIIHQPRAMQQSRKGAAMPKSPYVFPDVGFLASMVGHFLCCSPSRVWDSWVQLSAGVSPPFSGTSECYGSLCRPSAPGLTDRFDPLIDLA